MIRAVAHLAVKVDHVDFEATFLATCQDGRMRTIGRNDAYNATRLKMRKKLKTRKTKKKNKVVNEGINIANMVVDEDIG